MIILMWISPGVNFTLLKINSPEVKFTTLKFKNKIFKKYWKFFSNKEYKIKKKNYIILCVM